MTTIYAHVRVSLHAGVCTHMAQLYSLRRTQIGEIETEYSCILLYGNTNLTPVYLSLSAIFLIMVKESIHPQRANISLLLTWPHHEKPHHTKLAAY